VDYAGSPPKVRGNDANRLQPQDRTVHNWYRFVLSFPPHFVRDYLQRFGISTRQRVLDPFCGTGTTLVECKKLGIPSVGLEANPVAHFASQVKIDWTPEPAALLEHALQVAQTTLNELHDAGIEDDPIFYAAQNGQYPLRSLLPESQTLLLSRSISPLPLHKALVLLEHLEHYYDLHYTNHERLALANALVTSISNLHFGPEVGVGPSKPDAPVVASWLRCIRTMADDLQQAHRTPDTVAEVHCGDARCLLSVLEPSSIDAVITSPPYPNEKDYTRTTRLESVLLGFVHDKTDLRTLKRGLVRSNTRGVYKGDDDDRWVADYPEIQRIAATIEARRIELGKTSGFERLYAKVTKLYFGGMARHLAELRVILRPGAMLAYVVGDQASYLRIPIPTGQLLAGIGQSLAYDFVGLDLFRTRLVTATRTQLREEVRVLRWPG
jgi:hypothetical protein